MSQLKRDAAVGHEQVRAFYDEEYYADADGFARAPWHVRKIADRLGDFQGRSVLDVACGTGVWLHELAQRGANVSGIDISSRAVETCRKHLPWADIREGVAESLPFDSDSIDLVTCLGSLEHFLDQRKALEEMRRVARPNAKFLILVPNAGFLTRRLGLYAGTAQVAVKETVRRLEEWEELFESARLQVTTRWRDLHPLALQWIALGTPWAWPVRAAQAVALTMWPISWQYQVYFFCEKR